MRALSQHTLLEFYDCDPSKLKHARNLKTLLRDAVLAGGGTIVKSPLKYVDGACQAQ